MKRKKLGFLLVAMLGMSCAQEETIYDLENIEESKLGEERSYVDQVDQAYQIVENTNGLSGVTRGDFLFDRLSALRSGEPTSLALVPQLNSREFVTQEAFNTSSGFANYGPYNASTFESAESIDRDESLAANWAPGALDIGAPGFGGPGFDGLGFGGGAFSPAAALPVMPALPAVAAAPLIAAPVMPVMPVPVDPFNALPALAPPVAEFLAGVRDVPPWKANYVNSYGQLPSRVGTGGPFMYSYTIRR